MKLNADNDWVERWHTISNQVNRIDTEEELQQLLQQLCKPITPQTLAFVNAHAMNTIAVSVRFFSAIHAADVLLRDGSGMAALFRMLARSPGLNLNGTDLIPKIISRFSGKRIAIFGTQEPYLDAAKEAIQRTFPPGSMLTTAHGFLEVNAYISLAIKIKPDLVILGMGMPKQEEVAAALRKTLAFPCLIICGGAIIDFLGGKIDRAPRWMRDAGLEWLHRLFREPTRLFPRYVIGNPVFLIRAARFLCSAKRRHPV